MALTNPLSKPAHLPRAHWVHHPHGTQPHCCPMPLQIQSCLILSPFSAQTAEPSSSQDSAPEVCVQLSPVLGECPEWLHHSRPTPKMGSSTQRNWRTLALQEHQAPFKSQSFMFSFPGLLRCNMISLPTSHTVPRATEVQRVCNSTTSVCCCSGKHLRLRISTKVLENTKNGPLQSY